MEKRAKLLYEKGIFDYGIQQKDLVGKDKICFNKWKNMLKRCYSDEQKYDRYKRMGCVVSEEWLSFSNFKKWFDDNYYEIQGETIELDKDVLSKGNNVYSKETCVFVPKSINQAYILNSERRGLYPIGVGYKEKTKKYTGKISMYGKKIKKDCFQSINEAFEWYKKVKENYIYELAENYKFQIPSKLYESMKAFTVDITD